MTTWLFSLALAASVDGRVTVAGSPVVDAEVVAIGPGGRPVAGPVYTDRKGRFTLDVPDGARLRADAIVRGDDGSRWHVVAPAVAVADADRIALDHRDDGAGPVRMARSRAREVRRRLARVRRAFDDVAAACGAVLDAPDRAAAREAAAAHVEGLLVAGGTGFEGCVRRRYGQEEDVAAAERFTHAIDAAAGVADQNLWTGLASLGFARWADAHHLPLRARRAAGVATQRFAGVIDARAGTPESGAARPLHAEAYEIEGRNALRLGDAGGGVAKYHQALRVYRHVGDVAGMGRAHLGIARGEAARGRADAAREHVAKARGYPLTPVDRARADWILADLGGDGAIEAARAAIDTFVAVGGAADARKVRIRLAELLHAAGDAEGARAVLAEARAGIDDTDPLMERIQEVEARIGEAPDPG